MPECKNVSRIPSGIFEDFLVNADTAHQELAACSLRCLLKDTQDSFHDYALNHWCDHVLSTVDSDYLQEYMKAFLGDRSRLQHWKVSFS